MSVLDSLAEIREQALAELRSRKSLDELDQLRVSVFGKSGSLTSILRTMGKMDPQERAAVGKEANKVKQALARLSDFTFTFHSHALEKEMATRSSVLAWRIPGTGSLVGCRLWGHTESGMTEAT